MYITDLAFEKIKEFEGCRLQAYQDAVGVWTIGYGHTNKVMPGDRISQYLAEEYLREDIAKAERQVRVLGVCKTTGQLEALTSFVFNLGISRLRASTLLKVIRAGGSEANIRHEFLQWALADGRRMKGLVKRRQWEADRFFE